MILSPKMEAFDIEREPESVRDRLRSQANSPRAAYWPAGWWKRA